MGLKYLAQIDAAFCINGTINSARSLERERQDPRQYAPLSRKCRGQVTLLESVSSLVQSSQVPNHSNDGLLPLPIRVREESCCDILSQTSHILDSRLQSHALYNPNVFAGYQSPRSCGIITSISQATSRDARLAPQPQLTQTTNLLIADLLCLPYTARLVITVRVNII